MTYNGSNVVNASENNLITAPNHTSFYDLETANGSYNIFSATAPNRRHYSYIAGNYVYFLQGSTSGTRGFTVFKAPLTDPMNIMKTGNQILTAEVSSHTNITLLTVGDHIYIYGINGTTAIYRASVANPEVWSKMTNVLPFAITGSNATVIGSTIYIFGDGTTGGNSRKILTADISAPTAFVDSGALIPAANSRMHLSITPTTLFLHGGQNAGDNAAVYSAPISTPLVWTNVGPMTGITSLGSRDGYVSGGYIYLIGGDATGTLNSGVWRSPITDGVAFTAVQTSGYTHSCLTSQAINGRLYTYGGAFAVAAGSKTEVSIADLDNNVATPWKTANYNDSDASPGAYDYMGIGVDNYYYMYGGRNAGVTLSRINRVAMHTPTATSRGPTNFDNTITAYTLPIELQGGGVVRVDDTIYIFGGYKGGFGTHTNVYSAPASSPEIVSSISTTGGFNSTHFKPFIANGYIYCIGGDDTINTTNSGIRKAPITNPGQFSGSQNSFPDTRTRYSLAVIGNYVYVFGGTTTIAGGTPGASTAGIYRSLLSELDFTGSSNWISVTTLATATQDAVMTISNGYLYLIGGASTGFTSIGTVQCCLISELAAGISNFKSLGSCGTASTLPTGVSAIYSNGDFYILGGRAGATSTATERLARTSSTSIMKNIDGSTGGTESTLAINTAYGNISSYNSFMQTGNFPWIVAKTT